MAEHTKGEWEISSYRPREIWIGADYHIATVHNFNSKEETQANARLIAAAPDLLAALEGLVNFHYHNDMGVKPQEYHNAIAAISKAQTKQSVTPKKSGVSK